MVNAHGEKARAIKSCLTSATSPGSQWFYSFLSLCSLPVSTDLDFGYAEIIEQ